MSVCNKVYAELMELGSVLTARFCIRKDQCKLNSAECKSSVQQLSIELYMHCSFMQTDIMLNAVQLNAACFGPNNPQLNFSLDCFQVAQ